MGACCSSQEKKKEQSDMDKPNVNDKKKEQSDIDKPKKDDKKEGNQKNQTQSKDKQDNVVDQEDIKPEINPAIKPFQVENEDVIDQDSDRENENQKSDANMAQEGDSKK